MKLTFRTILLLLLALALGCGAPPAANDDDTSDDDDASDDDDDDDDDDDGPIEPTWSNVQVILSTSCGACHTTNDREDLSDLHRYDDGYDMLVNRSSQQVPAMVRVAPSSLEDSYLWHKLKNTHLSVGGEDEPMPPEDRYPLPSVDIELIEGWIEAGALKD